jgi:NADH-quinone oxidoreductase subunit M
MVGAFQVNVLVAAGAATGVIFSAVYALTLYRKVALGVITNPKLEGILDLEFREWAIFLPLVVATLVFGFAPGYILNFTQATLHQLAETYQAAGAAP